MSGSDPIIVETFRPARVGLALGLALAQVASPPAHIAVPLGTVSPVFGAGGGVGGGAVVGGGAGHGQRWGLEELESELGLGKYTYIHLLFFISSGTRRRLRINSHIDFIP